MTKSLKQAATDALLMLEIFRETGLKPTSEKIFVDDLESAIDSLQEAIENTVLAEAEPLHIGFDLGSPEGGHGVEYTYIDGVLVSQRDSRKTKEEG